MKCLNRNKTLFYYALYDRKEELLDEYGNPTGLYQIFYKDPKPYRANISAAMGESATRQFGDLELYDKVIVFDDVNTPVDESAILWIDRLETTQPHDYIVKKRAISLNVVSLAVQKVNVT